jgi:hypothetical protein
MFFMQLQVQFKFCRYYLDRWQKATRYFAPLLSASWENLSKIKAVSSCTTYPRARALATHRGTFFANFLDRTDFGEHYLFIKLLGSHRRLSIIRTFPQSQYPIASWEGSL